MSPDAMTARLHLRRIRVLEVLVDLVEELVLAIGDLRRVVRRRCCGFTTASAHDRRCYQVCDLPTPLPAVGPLRPPLSTDRIEALGKVLQIRPELGAGWRMLQHLYGINLAADSDEANQALGAFIATYHQPPAPPPRVRKTHRNVVGVGDEIFAFHDTDRITNGPSKAPASPTLRTVPQRLVAHGMSPPTTNTKDEENRSASNVEKGYGLHGQPVPPTVETTRRRDLTWWEISPPKVRRGKPSGRIPWLVRWSPFGGLLTFPQSSVPGDHEET